MNIPKHIYMVGIGGIGMSALAQLLVSRGHAVSGSDREESPTTELLRAKGIQVFIGHDAASVPADTELLVYSDAVPAENAERMKAHDAHIKQSSYFEVLGEVSRSAKTVAVTGTHGKTTVTGMVAKILSDLGEKPTAVVGSIVRDFGSNFLPGRDDLFVVEACEYRDHVLELSPTALVITNIELDHTDFFPSLHALQDTFRQAALRVPADGVIIANPNDPNVAPVIQGAKARIVDYTQMVVGELQLLGEFNRENARAALAAAKAIFPQMEFEKGVHSLSEFKGSWRRFELKGKTPNGAIVYDDYAHHPTAVRKTIEAARTKFPGKRIVVAFHPHLYSRTESFLQEFADALDTADRAIVAPIYEARTEKTPTISHHSVADASTHVEAMDSFEEIRGALAAEPEGTLIITMGAGDIYKVAEQLTV
ncbi:MAG: Mur ligase domain-containing protein [Minisyncoccia bacterium]